jgi:F0F1-type ATP synthase membrane subunit b/b'
MSQLNLSPDPVVLAAQATIFLANMLVVKKLILEPYLSVRAKREASTGGSQDNANKLIVEAKALEEKITERMRGAHKDASAARDKIKGEHQRKRGEILSQAEVAAKAEQQKIESEIAKNLSEERSKKDETIKSLADTFFGQVTH